MTIDLGEHKSGFCVFDTDAGSPIQHGYVVSIDPEKMFDDLIAIAKSRRVKRLIVELSNRRDTVTVKLKRTVRDTIKKLDIPTEIHTAAEWRQALHFYSKRAERDDYKQMALNYVKKNFPNIYRDDMPDDEAEAICIAVAEPLGYRKYESMKDRRNEAARQKKNFFKHVEEDEYEYDEPTEYRKLYR